MAAAENGSRISTVWLPWYSKVTLFVVFALWLLYELLSLATVDSVMTTASGPTEMLAMPVPVWPALWGSGSWASLAVGLKLRAPCLAVGGARELALDRQREPPGGTPPLSGHVVAGQSYVPRDSPFTCRFVSFGASLEPSSGMPVER